MRKVILVDIVIFNGIKFFLKRSHLRPLASVVHSCFDSIRDDF